MEHTRIGEILAHQTNLSTHDVQEILADQNSSGRPFGQIAISWGLCQPEDLWRAWFEQLAAHTPRVKLQRIGVDSRVTSLVPLELAIRFGVMPLRSFENQVLFAISEKPAVELQEELSKQLGRPVRFVVADMAEITAARARYYELAA